MEARRFPGLCLLLAGNGERALEIRLRFRRIMFGRYERDFAGKTIGLGLEPRFL